MQVTVVCENLGFNLKALTSLRDREMMARYTRNDVVLASNLREYLSLVLADRGRIFGVADVRKRKSQKASQAVWLIRARSPTAPPDAAGVQLKSGLTSMDALGPGPA